MKRLMLALIVAVFWIATGAWGSSVEYTWTGAGGDSNWDNAGNWLPNAAPTITAYGPTVTTDISGTVVVRGLGMTGMGPATNVLNNGGIIGLVSQSGSTPTLIVTTVLNNAGQINVSAGMLEVGNSASVPPWTDPTAPVTFTGGGTINMTGGMLLITSPLTLNGQTIQGTNPAGSGLVTCNDSGGMTILAGNMIQANGGNLTVAGSTISNGGILQAVNGGTLQLAGGHWSYGPTYVNGGIIQALNGSTVLLGYTNPNDYDGAGSVTGGTLITAGSGVIQASTGMVLNGIANQGNLQVVNTGTGANTAVLANTITNIGTITLAGGNLQLNVQMFIPGSATLTGGGTVNMGGYNFSGATPNGANGTLTNADNLIQGAGSFSSIVIYNQSMINANTSGQKLSFTSATINNSGGTLQAANGGTMQIGGGHWSGGPAYVNGGTIQALDGSTVRLGYTNPGDYDSAGTITGSTLKTAGSGVIQASTYVVLDGIANQGNLQVVNTGVGAGSNTAILANTINNTGTITLAGGNLQLNIQMFVPGNATLSGGGTVNMGGYVFYGQTPNGANGTLTNLDNHIQGAGSFYSIDVENAGVIDANTSGQTLSFYGGSTINNNSGTVQAGNGGTLYVDALANQGTVQVAAGSSMTIGALTNLSGGALAGGTYAVAGTLHISGPITTSTASITLDGPSAALAYAGGDALAGFSTNLAGGGFTIQNGRNFTTAGGFANAGAMNIGTGSTFQVGPIGSLGTYTQTAGSTKLNGTLTAGTLDIEGGTLSGAGMLNAGLLVKGILSPGNSPGTITINGDYTQDAAGTLDIEAAMGLADLLDVHGNATLGGTLNISAYGDWSGSVNDHFLILDWTGSKIGTFAQVNLPDLNGYQFNTEWESNGLYLDVTTVPEPATASFFVIGTALLMGGLGRRRPR